MRKISLFEQDISSANSQLNRTLSEKEALIVSKQQEYCRHLGWDAAACEAYVAYVEEQLEYLEKSAEEILVTSEEGIHLVGSSVYFHLFKHSQLAPREKVRLVLDQLGRSLDEHGMLQLSGLCRIDLDMSPHSEFLEQFAACVKIGYPGGLIAASHPTISWEELKCVHQLRYYFDRQNLFYIRSSFKGKTDYEKLLAYSKQTGQKLNYRDSSRFHNRVRQSGKTMNSKYRSREGRHEQTNDKIKTANGLSEFILNVETGCFVSQWNRLKTIGGKLVFDETKESTVARMKELIDSNPENYDLTGHVGKEIADTESFNYDRGFFDWLPWRRAHDYYDMKPSGQEKFDSDLRKLAKRKWPFPQKYKECYRTARSIQKVLKKEE
ncbi:DUF3114 domain-containing protein [Enterococcus sp. BWT-B8]|uniref:DUF3114 domain-containing protein n=1 Tax=Enterococcus sp. BWT-B8 TaxID=2885157 RepID=UPI001E2890EA|nr:DUF3114 domain-containing protein [Enterococcus sp. BWT-B8]MCB5952483.1 DUF3114 domain-containing protein [Enterococcus sp. BWT-B8]